ncbi:MAG TPA: Dyp-type peroxidase [Candidatus Limnocylindrales bacterium]|nr:Dyp-type peroxidase [Candidatus Limnocylindrales bacterium]
MSSPQNGIFALGSPSHSYLELNLLPGAKIRELVTAMADLREPRTTIGGVNFVSGFRPELWRELVPDGLPEDLMGFNHDLIGADGYIMPAAQHDAVLWLSGSSYDVVFDEARQAISALAALTTVADETSSWAYRRYRDLTGFEDGTKNPSILAAPNVVLIPEAAAGAGGTVLLLQQWAHDATAWEALPQSEQERIIGRTKPDSVELDPQPRDSHVARTDQEKFGNIFRRNMPYGTVTAHGTMFVGFSATQGPLRSMLESMAGVEDGVRDALTRYTKPLTGAYYFIPSTDAILQFADSGSQRD